MADGSSTSEASKPKYTRAFWTANMVELLERAAWYGVFIAITLYLSRILGFTDIEAASVSGAFSAGLYFLPTFSGAYADKIGFRRALLIAFGLLTVGYFGMWVLPSMIESAGLATYGKEVEFTGLKETSYRWFFVPVMLVIMVGGSFIKSVITGTIARETTEANRARGYSIFYAMVNIGAFGGKTVVKPLRQEMGDHGFVVLNLFAASMTALAFVLVFLLFKNPKSTTAAKSIAEIWGALKAVLARGRLVVLILIITGFWMVQHQLYASMPKYVLRMAGEGASPSWYANINPAAVVLSIGVVTYLMRKRTGLTSMTIGMFIMPVSAFCMASGNFVGTDKIFGMHPVAAMMIIGIAFQGIAESFISPRFLEYFSRQAPKGEEGLYLGFSHLHSFLSSLFGFVTSGFLLEMYVPDPKTLSAADQAQRLQALAGNGEMPEAYAHAHYLWFVFVGVAVVSAVSLVIYGRVVARMDARAEKA